MKTDSGMIRSAQGMDSGIVRNMQRPNFGIIRKIQPFDSDAAGSMQNPGFGISGSLLKWFAIITMAIDHMGAGLLESYVMNAWGGSPLGSIFLERWDDILAVDKIIRSIGRPAFPIFCFLLVQGFVHTHDVKKYAVRLGIFALISEIPFDLALRITPFYWKHQNAFFTLLTGLLTIWFMKRFQDRLWARMAGLIVGAALAELFHMDYGAFGIALIVLLCLLQDKKVLQCILGAVCCAWETTAPLAFILIWFYNGKRGRQPKWFFYWFYPVHLLMYALVGMYVLPAVFL